MPRNRPSDRREPHALNWVGKTVSAGGTVLRAAANLVDATAERVSHVAEKSRKAFERELDPNIEEARVIAEFPRCEDGDEEEPAT